MVILDASGVFCSSYRISGMLVILDILRGILVVLVVSRYFFVILEVSSYLWPFWRFWVYLGHFKGLGVFSPLYRFEGILVIFQV